MGISQILRHQFSSRFIYRRNKPRMSGNLHCFSTHFLCKAIRNLSTQHGKIGEALDSSIYLAFELWVTIVGYGKI